MNGGGAVSVRRFRWRRRRRGAERTPDVLRCRGGTACWRYGTLRRGRCCCGCVSRCLVCSGGGERRAEVGGYSSSAERCGAVRLGPLCTAGVLALCIACVMCGVWGSAVPCCDAGALLLRRKAPQRSLSHWGCLVEGGREGTTQQRRCCSIDGHLITVTPHGGRLQDIIFCLVSIKARL